jgi:rhomboid protease GluP
MPEKQNGLEEQQEQPWPDPIFTVSLIVANVAIFLLMVAKGVSFWSTNEQQALQWGANFGPLTLNIQSHQLWRLFTANFIHIGFLHLAINMIFLWALGRIAEYFFSSGDFLLLYTFTGTCSSLLGVIWQPNATSAGASGAIFGLSGALLVLLFRDALPVEKESREKLLSGVVRFTVLNLFVGGIQNYLPGIFHARVDNAGHIGGLLSGMLVGAVFAPHMGDSTVDQKFRRRTWILLYLGFFFLLILAFYYSNGMSVQVQRGLPGKH